MHTKSYWYANISNGSLFSNDSSPPCGIENGLWLKSIVPSSDNSYIGKSTIKQNLYTPFSIKSNLLPNSILINPAIFCAFANSSAIKNILDPFSTPISLCSFSFISSVINFAIPPEIVPSPSNFVHANPFAPTSSVVANSPILSKNFLPCFAPFGTTIAFIVLFLNALKSEFSNNFVTSWIINGFLKSGLSIPYFSIASLYGIRINGPLSTFQFVCFSNVYGTTSSITLKTSSCVAKLISKSNW